MTLLFFFQLSDADTRAGQLSLCSAWERQARSKRTEGLYCATKSAQKIAHIHVDSLQNRIVWMQSNPSHNIGCTQFFSGAHFIQCTAPINVIFGQPWIQ